MNKKLLKKIVSRLVNILLTFMLSCILTKALFGDMWLERSLLYIFFSELGLTVKKSDIIHKNTLIHTKGEVMIVFLVIIFFFTFVVWNLSDLLLVIPWIIIPFAFSLFWE